MKLNLVCLALLSSVLLLRGQGTIVWDQQATNVLEGSILLTSQPLGQAFTPSQSSIDVVAFNISNLSGSPADMEVNLLSGSITGTILGTSMSVTVPSDGVGSNDFFFANSIPLTPGTQYYLQLSSDVGSDVFANIVNAPDLNGGEIYDGVLHNGLTFGIRRAPLCRNRP
jgi:hypothetical protein